VVFHFLVRHFHIFGLDIQAWMILATALIVVAVYFSMRTTGKI
jgi:hypothetical protein